LRRRVPQAHLAPGLRIIPDEDGQEPPAAVEAGSALSRYQASRAAARSAVDEGGHEAAR